MTLLDAKPDQPHSKTLRYAVSGVALIILLTFALWFFVLRFLPEKRAVGRFMDAIVAGQLETAYQIWKPQSSYTYDRFLADWGPNGYYGPIKSYQIVSVRSPGGSSGTIVLVRISPEPSFPDEQDPLSAKTRSVALWVESRDMSFSFPP